jgi:hypothetical protein
MLISIATIVLGKNMATNNKGLYVGTSEQMKSVILSVIIKQCNDLILGIDAVPF